MSSVLVRPFRYSTNRKAWAEIMRRAMTKMRKTSPTGFGQPKPKHLAPGGVEPPMGGMFEGRGMGRESFPSPLRQPVEAGATAAEMPGSQRVAMERLMGRSPGQEETYARLLKYKDIGGEFVEQPTDLPYGKAMEELVAGKGYTASTKRVPPVNILDVAGERAKQTMQSTGLGPGVGYKKRVYKQIKTESEKIKPAVQERIKEVTKGVSHTPVEEDIFRGMLLQRMWKYMDGRSAEGRMWKVYLQGARGKPKGLDSNDYFIRIGLKWMEDPARTTKLYPRETQALERLKKDFISEYGAEVFGEMPKGGG